MSTSSKEAQHPIQVVARRTGLTPDVIRAWERRYGVVEPRRSPTSRRLYTDSEIGKLKLLRRATLAGRRISDVAHLPLHELAALVDADDDLRIDESHANGADDPTVEHLLHSSLRAVEDLDAHTLQTTLERAALHLGIPALLEGVLTPLMHEIGQRWRSGSLRIAHEHLATTLVRSLLGTLRTTRSHPLPGPDLVVATLPRQIHELGALMVAAAAAAAGWRVTYLGSDLPSQEIAAAARSRDAAAVALSLIHPAEDPALAVELRRLAASLPDGVALLAGGAAAAFHRPLLQKLGAAYLDGIGALLSELREIRDRGEGDR